MHVLATAGHVDHGKSTLVRALTGMEPDRLAEERRRGMTLDLGFAWTELPGGETVAFVDVPGHERFVGTMLAGVGAVPGVLVVVAADEGWCAQTVEHVTVLDSLGVRHGLLAVTKSDLADPAPVLADVRARLARTSLGDVPAVAVSAVTGAGIGDLRDALRHLISTLPDPVTDDRIRLFVDRAFTVRGSGTVVTGTLREGTIRRGDRLLLEPGGTEVRVRALQSLNQPVAAAPAVARVAVNLRGVPVDRVRRGHALVTPDAWVRTGTADIRLAAIDPAALPGDLVLHLGSAAVPCRVRPLGEDTARLHLATELPLEPGDRGVLREPSSRLATGIMVLDVDPPPLRRRGAALARAVALESATGRPDVLAEVARRGCTTRQRLAQLGILDSAADVPSGLIETQGYLVCQPIWQQWGEALAGAVDAYREAAPLEPGLPATAAAKTLGLPDHRLIDALVRASGGRLTHVDGRVARPGTGPTFTGVVRRAIDDVRARLDRDPLGAPDIPELVAAGLTKDVLAAAAHAGWVLRLPGEVILHPSAPSIAATTIADLDQPFTLSEARKALRTTRRVAVPLLEHLDSIGLTIRVDGSLRRACSPVG